MRVSGPVSRDGAATSMFLAKATGIRARLTSTRWWHDETGERFVHERIELAPLLLSNPESSHVFGGPGIMRLNAKSFWQLLKETGSEWMTDKAPRLGAALAYYTVFSLAPLLVIIIGIAGLVLGHDA